MKLMVEDIFKTGCADIFQLNFIKDLKRLRFNSIVISKSHIEFREDSIKRHALHENYSYKEVEWDYGELHKIYPKCDLIVFDAHGADEALYDLMFDKADVFVVPINLDKVEFHAIEEIEQKLRDLVYQSVPADIELICFSAQEPHSADDERKILADHLKNVGLAINVLPGIIQLDEALNLAFERNMSLWEFDPDTNDSDRFLEITKELTAFELSLGWTIEFPASWCPTP